MKILILSFVFILASAKRTPRIGIPLDEIQNELELQPRINILERTKIDQATLQIRAQIEQVNNRLTQDEKDVLISNAEENDPEGYECENQVLEVKEISFVDQVLCYNTTEEICSMTQKTVFTPKVEKKCDIHFKKVCWIDYKEQARNQNVRICSTKPERKCDLSDAEKQKFRETECNVYYETVCQTIYTQKTVLEDQPVCKNEVQKMCDDNGENCMEFTKKICNTKQVSTLKAIPSTSCDQIAKEICVTPECPLVVENKVCRDVEKTFVTMVPKESCELSPREVCTDVVKQYPALVMSTNCELLPRETCSPERVQPKEVTRPVIKKICTPPNKRNGARVSKLGQFGF